MSAARESGLGVCLLIMVLGAALAFNWVSLTDRLARLTMNAAPPLRRVGDLHRNQVTAFAGSIGRLIGVVLLAGGLLALINTA